MGYFVVVALTPAVFLDLVLKKNISKQEQALFDGDHDWHSESSDDHVYCSRAENVLFTCVCRHNIIVQLQEHNGQGDLVCDRGIQYGLVCYKLVALSMQQSN